MSSKKRDLVGNYEVTNEGIVTRREVLLMGAMAAATGMAVHGSQAEAKESAAAPAAAAAVAGAYKAKDFNALAGTMDGFSAGQIKQHLGLYAGYVAKSNAIHEALKTVDLSTANATYSALRELLIEQSFAHNGVVYHEYYFGNLGGKGGEPKGSMKSAIEEQWGSTGKFMDFLKAAGKSARGWVIVGYNTRAGYVDAYALDLHNLASPANIVPLVVLDVYEHAYMIDYGTDRAKYLEAFINNMNWDVVEKRLSVASKHPGGGESTN
ncbi:MAG: hypothetical protein K2X93_11625 [Candidatus Obscuribacterales bacterium]|nr:hypothetical protein [Candidatus Obscuribacterales bacterium]